MSAAVLAAELLGCTEAIGSLGRVLSAAEVARGGEPLELAQVLEPLEAGLRDAFGPPEERHAEAAAVLRTAEVLVDDLLLRQPPSVLVDPVTDLVEQLLELFQQTDALVEARVVRACERHGGEPGADVVHQLVAKRLGLALAELERAWPAEALDATTEVLREVRERVEAELG